MSASPAPAVGAADLHRRLPHRFPFLLLDRVEALSPGDRLPVETVVSRPFGPLAEGAIPALVVGEVAAQERKST
ncbi:MAG: hypothetical protein KDD47_27975, partial [Acidobacteria bacterium]|nr:hypothetical protein [Acidobacteriota bacterium]